MLGILQTARQRETTLLHTTQACKGNDFWVNAPTVNFPEYFYRLKSLSTLHTAFVASHFLIRVLR